MAIVAVVAPVFQRTAVVLVVAAVSAPVVPGHSPAVPVIAMPGLGATRTRKLACSAQPAGEVAMTV